ncbi:MAG: ankyrin repeat domain-containing protein [Treponemataceae bacterium]|nr:ankyrin repeat domain-containing protein [Treponemataceae bacterium]
MKVFLGIIILIIVLYNLCKRYGDKVLVAVLGALPIVGLFCGRALVLGSTGFWLWLLALAGEVFALFVIGYCFSEGGSDTDSTYPKVLTVIGIALWGIALKLVFWDKTLVFGILLFVCIFIAPYLIVVSLDAFFGGSVSAMVFIGIVKMLSSFFLYLGNLIDFLYNARIYNKTPWMLTAYFVIVSLLALLSFILVIFIPAVCAIGNLKQQRQMQKEQWQKQKIIQKESKRKQIKEKYSYRLISAVEENDAKTVAALIEKGADANYKDFSGKVPLRIAMENDNKNMISLLLEKGANIECEDNNGCRPLQNAVENGNLEMVSFLLEKGAFINCKDSLGQTPLLMALRYNNKNMISLLLEKGAAINIFDSNSKSALDFAIENEDADLVSLLLEKGAEIGDSDSSLKTALDFAIKNDDADLLSRLAEKAAREDVQCEDRPILFFAIENNYKKLVELLIEKGANIECKGKYEATPLLTATSNGNLDLVSLLLEKGANIECENEDGVTPLFAAIVKGNFDIISLLIERGANIEHEVKNTYTPLGCAVAYKNKEIVSFLIEKGANIEYAAKYGVTPLVQAINVEDKEIISILIEKGADVNHVSKLKDTETTPLFIATSGNNAEEIVSLLIENGADVNLTTTNGFNVLQKSICDRNKRLVLLFLDAGAEINKNSNKLETALLDAVDTQNYDSEIVSLLIEKGADVDLESAFNGHIPLTLAVSQNNKDAVSILLKNGADPNKKSSKFGTPLGIAFFAVNREMISLLMKNGADSSEIFYCAAAMPKPNAAQFLLDNGADVNCEFSGQTPLISAICLSTKEMVLFLISNGADVNYETSGNVSDKTGARTPLETAIVKGNAEMVSLLITYGADVNHKCKNGNTPLLFAARHQRTELVSILKEAGAISFVPAKGTQTAVNTTSSANPISSENSADFNAALVALSKIIAKNSAEIFAPENNQKLKALISDLIPQENEIAPKLKQALSCDFAQIILDATDKSDKKKETSFKKSVDKIAAEIGLEKSAAVSIVKLVALSLDWNLENLNLE